MRWVVPVMTMEEFVLGQPDFDVSRLLTEVGLKRKKGEKETARPGADDDGDGGEGGAFGKGDA